MKIKILGTRGEVENSAPYHSKHSGVLLDETILFDLGEKEFLKYKPKYIFLTHLHPDHAFFIREPVEIKKPIYGPEKYKDGLEVKVLSSPIKVNSYEITPIPTHHSKKVKSVGYLVKKGKEKFLYTGDLIWINKEYHHLLANLDLVITEGSFIRCGGMVRKDKKTGKLYGHTGIPNLIDLFKKFAREIVFVHFGNWFYEDIKKARKKLHQLAQKNNLIILIGYDGMILRIKKLSSSQLDHNQ